MQELGFDVVEINIREFIKTRYSKAAQAHKTVTSHHPARYHKAWKDGETYMLLTSSHILTIIDGVNYDWSKGRSLQAYRLFKIVKKVS